MSQTDAPPPDEIGQADPAPPRRRARRLRAGLRTGLRWIVLFSIFPVLFSSLLLLYPVDARVFRAALTQPLVKFDMTPDGPRFVGCICDSTLRHDEIPQVVRDAVISTEDRRFHYHLGIDPLSLGRAVLSGGASGGSTLEMQLAKNTLSGASGHWLRKYVELYFATRISLSYSKRDILRLYLSRVNFGRAEGVAIFGLRDAAHAWFGKPPEALAVEEAAFLVGLINGPTIYDPLRHPDAALRRAELVLRRMRAAGALPEGRDIDLRAHLPTRLHRLPGRDRFLEDQIMREVAAIAGDLPLGRHYAVTTIDPIAQDQARRVLRREAKKAAARGVARAGLISLDPSGRMLAMVGGLDYRASTWNLATQAERQAASTAKLATYLAALEAGWTASSLVQDDPAELAGPFVPRNVDGRYKGRIPMHQCLRESRNVCTMWLAERVGLDEVAEMAQRIGLTAGPMPGSSIVLGAAETTLARNAAAFLAVANGGIRHEPHLLRAVLGQKGKVLHRVRDGGERVLSPETAAAMTALLGEVTARGGTGAAAQFRGGSAFGKTGTSQENRDAWFVGFADHGVVTAIWAGPAEGGQMRNLAGGDMPARTFAYFNVNLVERLRGYTARLPQEEGSYWRDVNVP